MAKVIKVNPTSAGRRSLVKVSRQGIYKGRPYAPLVKSISKTGGRNNQGRLTVRHRGGGHKQAYRQIDFKRDKLNIAAKVERIEYDPKRTAYIALVVYKDGERRYILAPQGLSVGDTVISGIEAPIKPGNCLPLRNIPLGTVIHAVSLKVGKKAQLARSAGSFATLVARESGYATLRLPSSEVRKVNVECTAAIGAASNPEHDLAVLGKAGANRWRGRRPTVRGVAMNPVDHPLGGGEGRSSGGRHPVSFSGVKEGARTRNNKRTDRSIVERRKRK
jgi:large subunit ribosomal protein L2